MIKLIKKAGKKVVPFYLQPAGFYKKMRGNGKVMTGPFKGMQYINNNVGSCYSPKLYGTYEMELHHIINKVKETSFDKIVIIGGGEGYYAVGLGLALPDTQVLVYEINSKGRNSIQELANINRVKNIHVFGECTSGKLSEVISKNDKCFCLVDIEGAEVNVLDSDIIANLQNSFVLVEIHDFISKQIGPVLTSRFNKSHNLTEILENERSLKDLPVSLNLLEKVIYKREVLAWLCEYRGEKMRWFYFQPKQ